jgi:phosphoribosylformylglycinamidine synthase
MADAQAMESLSATGQIVLKYADDHGRPTQEYPANPNGSAGAAAGVCDRTGRIFGLMPHPERFVKAIDHPRWTRLPDHLCIGQGLRIFQGAVAECSS